MRRAAAALLLAPALLAQGLTSGSLQGAVRAADGTPLAGAGLVLEELRTGRTHAATSGPDGGFRFLGLAPGPCRLTVRAAGYAGQRLTGLRVAPGSATDCPVELIPMESDLVMDLEAPSPGAGGGPNPTRLGAALLQDLPRRTRGGPELADLDPWPLLGPGLRVDGLDLGPGGPTPVDPEALDEVRIRAGGGEADAAGGDALLATTRGGGNAPEGRFQAAWGPASGGPSDRGSAALGLSGPLRPDRLFMALDADRARPGDGSAGTRGAIRLDWLPTEGQQATLQALDAEASGPGGGRDRALALAHRWSRDGLVQEARLQALETEAPGGDPGRTWTVAEALGFSLGAHDLQAGGEFQQLRAGSRPGADLRRSGLFLEDSWRVAAPFTLRLGLRHDREAFGLGGAREGASPRLAFVWHLSEQVTLEGGHGRFLDPTPEGTAPPAPTAPGADRWESRLGLVFRPLPDLALTVEGRSATGRLVPGGGDGRLDGGSLGGRWEVGRDLELAAAWTQGTLRGAGPGRPDGPFRRLRLWGVWRPQAWTLALVGRLQSGALDPVPGLPVAPSGAPVLDARLARTLVQRRWRLEVGLDAFDLLDRTRPAPAGADAGRRVQVGVRASF